MIVETREAPLPLVTAAWLASSLERPGLRVVDVTTNLRRLGPASGFAIESGRPSFLKKHIPNSAYVDMVELSDRSAPLLNALLSPQQFERAAGAAGIGAGTHVVIYSQSTPMWSNRLQRDGRQVDVGLAAWEREGLPLAAGPHAHPVADFTARVDDSVLARMEDVLNVASGNDHACLVNALSPATFHGHDQGSASRPGRIPTSLNLHWESLINPDDGHFRITDEIRAIAADNERSATPIAYCGGGVAATVVLFALFLAGLEDGRLYDGSLNEWASHPDLPLITDDNIDLEVES